MHRVPTFLWNQEIINQIANNRASDNQHKAGKPFLFQETYHHNARKRQEA